jgi:branched-chain amino acid transport system permease protein
MFVISDIIIPGLLLGGIYALVSVGLSLQYGVARVLNIAHGQFIMVGAFVTWWLNQAIHLNPLVSLVIVGPLCFVIGWALHSTLFRRLMATSSSIDVFEGKSLLATFGLYYIAMNVARLIWGGNDQGLTFLNRAVTRAEIPVNRLVALGFVIVLGTILYLFLSRTRMGKAIRASAQDPSTAGLMGVNIHSVLAVCFGLGLALAGVAGTLISTILNINTSMGLEYTVIAVIVVVLGGMGSISGAMIGGLALGLISALVTHFDPSWHTIAYYVIFVLLLLARPKGIMGK